MRQRGQAYEQHAQRFLEQQGLRLVAANVHSRFGELDLIMRDQQHLVFVEVKYRQNAQFGGAAAAVTASKQRKLRQCAQWYLQQHGSLEQPCRFDVVAIDGEQINWIQNAF